MPILVAGPPEEQAELRQCLGRAGFPMVCLASSIEDVEEALGLWNPLAPATSMDLVILGCGLPQAGVLTLCREIRRWDRWSGLSVVVMADEQGRPEPDASFDAGATEWISGSLDRPENLARIRRAVKVNETASHSQKVERQREEELSLARLVQRRVLSKPIYTDSIEIEAEYIPHGALSGDMYFWCEISPGRYGILLTDVMGHGPSASLACMALRTIMHALVTRVVDPVVVLEEMEKHIHLVHPHSATALYVVIDTVNHTVEYANAGHPPGLLLQASGRIDVMERTALPLGFDLPGRPQKRILPLEVPARLVLYTDGLVEQKGCSIRSGITQLQERLGALRRLGTSQFIAATVMAFNKHLAVDDDLTLITVTVRESSPQQ
ncbi:MAG TPA: SpoIIE family protein phosphatase [Symbiobacteriaceae bacterium]|nr:SpoIIE family protein phosphatase [Symbiobacteriaceae bacterium]